MSIESKYKDAFDRGVSGKSSSESIVETMGLANVLEKPEETAARQSGFQAGVVVNVLKAEE